GIGVLKNTTSVDVFERSFKGNLTVSGDRGDEDDIDVSDNTVGNNLSFSNNSSGEGDVFDNTVTNSLVCLNNTPPPLNGGNTARQFVGQCTAGGNVLAPGRHATPPRPY